MKTTLLAAGLLALAPAAFGAGAGSITMQTGTGSAVAADGTVVRSIAKGDTVNSGETLVTGPNSYMGVTFTDGGSVILRPDSRFLIESYAYGAAPAEAAKPAVPAAVAKPAAVDDGKPRITGVTPAVVPAGTGKRAFAVNGTGFKPGAKLLLIDTTTGKQFPGRVPASVASNKIERNTNFGAGKAKWQVVVVNADGTRSEPFDFGVGVEVAAVPQLAPAPAAAAAAAPAPAPTPAPATTPLTVVATAPASGQNAAFRLLRGGFRAVSGAIGKINKSEYKVSTSVATIGIRGTDYYVYLCDSACAADPTVAASAGVAGNPQGGILIGVIKGGVFTTNGAGAVTEVAQDQHLMVLPDGTSVSLPVEPRFLRVDPIPDPKNCK